MDTRANLFSRSSHTAGRASVFRHPQVVEDQARAPMELPHLLRHIGHAFGFDDTDGKASEAGDVFRAVPGSYPATVFVEVPVDDVMAAVLDAPVAPVCLQYPLSVGLLRRAAGDAVGEFAGFFPVFFSMRSRPMTRAWPTWGKSR